MSEARCIEHEGRLFRVPVPLTAVNDDGARLALGLVHGTLAFDGSALVAYDPAGVDLNRVRNGTAPLLIEHVRSVSCIVGHCVGAWLEDGILRVLCRFGHGGEADRLWSLLGGGCLALSIGARIKHAVPGEETPEGPTFRAVAWELLEVSVVCHGACSQDYFRALSDREDIKTAVERVNRPDVAAAFAARATLKLDRWAAWAPIAGVRIARRLGVDADRAIEVMRELVAEQCTELEAAHA